MFLTKREELLAARVSMRRAMWSENGFGILLTDTDFGIEVAGDDEGEARFDFVE